MNTFSTAYLERVPTFTVVFNHYPSREGLGPIFQLIDLTTWVVNAVEELSPFSVF